jgi:F-type H+-transporting ATPase subunit delta
MSAETIARRYAGALADVVLQNGETEIVKTELNSWNEMMNSNADLLNAFSNPAIAHLSKEKILKNLIEKTKPSKTTANFLRILLKNGRLTDLGEINSRFETVLAERRGEISGQVISARPLGEDEKSEIKRNLDKLTGKKTKLNFATDETIIGGVVASVGSTIYDGSVKTQLENLKQQMIGN